MIQTRALEVMTDQHRQDLMTQAGRARGSRQVSAARTSGATQRSATGFPVTGGRAVRRAMAPRVGAWLIAFGTRLGGATVRTSS